MTTDSVFISYSNKDVDLANEIANSLKAGGINIWIDTINGKDDDDIQEAIKSAKLFLIITSNNAFEDETLKQEKNFARKNNIERVLVKIEACDTDNEFRWDTLPCIDYIENKEEGLQAIFKRLNINPEIKEEDSSSEREVVQKSSANDFVKETETTKEALQEISSEEKTSPINKEDLLTELSEDFDYYRFKMNNQIRSSYYGLGALIAVSIILLVGLYFFDGLQQFMEDGQEKLKYLGTIGGLLPSTLGSFSFSKIKEKKKRRDGIEDFERIVSRMKTGLIPNTNEHIIALEDDFIKYTKS